MTEVTAHEPSVITEPRTPLSRPRIASIDLVRGLIMVFMALDHVRDHFSSAGFDPTNLAQTTPTLFFTRWITHFCAPGFMLLAGTSAYLFLANRKRSRGQLARFLLVRGILLVMLELTVVSFAWTFSVADGVFALQVIWALGWSMIALAFLIFLPRWVIGVFSVALIAGHHLLEGIQLTMLPEWTGWLVSILHFPRYPVLYPLIPWVGVMALGYVLGPMFQFEPKPRQRVLLLLGAAMIALFLLLRTINQYGDPSRWLAQPEADFTILAFLNTTKYPPSFLFLLMTLGPLFIVLALLEHARGWIADCLIAFGRVPLFYYLIHLYLIHGLALLVGTASGYPADDFLRPYPQFPPDYGFGLPIVYLIWLGVVLLLYLPCRWFGALKKRYPALRYW